jgi:hypothetical protein
MSKFSHAAPLHFNDGGFFMIRQSMTGAECIFADDQPPTIQARGRLI